MDKKQKAIIKKFVEDEEMFNTVKAYLFAVKEPDLQANQSLQDFGAITQAFRNVKKAMLLRFDNMRIDASRKDENEA